MIKTLSEHDSYVQMKRAFDRLRVKELVSGPVTMYPGGAFKCDDTIDKAVCCAIGVANVHANIAGEVETLRDSIAGWDHDNRRFYYNTTADRAVIECNEDFRYGKNDTRNRRARFRHVYKWLENKIQETTPKHAVGSYS